MRLRAASIIPHLYPQAASIERLKGTVASQSSVIKQLDDERAAALKAAGGGS